MKPNTATGLYDNISKPNELLDNGLKIARAGFDVRTASNANLLFNSSWPSLQEYKVMTVTFTGFPPYDGSFTHNLNFPPLAIAFNYAMGNMQACSVDENRVYYRDIRPRIDDFSAPNNVWTIIVYPIDISVDVDYPYTDTPSANVPYNPDYGIKVVKNGRDISSNDLRDYILHSRAGSPMVLAVKTQDSANSKNTTDPTSVQYTSNVGYQTLVFGFQGLSQSNTLYPSLGAKGYVFAPQQSQAPPSTFTSGTTSTVVKVTGDSSYTTKSSLVVLRSPMFSSIRQSVVY